MLQIGDLAPDFELLTDENQPLRLSDLRGRRVVLFFFPRADTPGCTAQACGFRDRMPVIEAGNATVLGLSPDLPEALAKKLPRYPSVPVARVGRLAVDQAFHGKKLGGALLADAADRAARSEVAIFALIVDAKDDKAADFYRHHGFEPLGAKSRQLFVPLERFRAAAS